MTPSVAVSVGTLLIDTDANGVGWFIDTTPWENSEFNQTLTDTAFRATTGDAVGKYDLLTTILHGQIEGLEKGDIKAQVEFVSQIFGVAA